VSRFLRLRLDKQHVAGLSIGGATVHADDIASSAGISCLDLPGLAWTLAAGVVAEITARDSAKADFVRAVARPRRSAPTA
jgi:hypothetical protein